MFLHHVVCFLMFKQAEAIHMDYAEGSGDDLLGNEDGASGGMQYSL